MKNQLTIICLFVLTCCISAPKAFNQNDSIPNGNFEVWIDNPFQNYSEPEHWNTPNPFTSVPFVNVVTVEKDSVDPHSGTYAAKLSTKFVLNGRVPGIMTLGNIEIDINTFTGEITGGIPYKQQPAYLTGYFKYSPEGPDSCLIVANLYRYIPVKGKKESIALATFKTNKDTSDWAYFSVPFEYFNDTILPDTLNITAISSSSTEDPQVGSVLYVDDIKLEGILGIYQHGPSARNVPVFPNPAVDQVTIRLETFVSYGDLLIFDSRGKQVLFQNVNGKMIRVNTSILSAGFYYFYILENGIRKAYGSFIINR